MQRQHLSRTTNYNNNNSSYCADRPPCHSFQRESQVETIQHLQIWNHAITKLFICLHVNNVIVIIPDIITLYYLYLDFIDAGIYRLYLFVKQSLHFPTIFNQCEQQQPAGRCSYIVLRFYLLLDLPIIMMRGLICYQQAEYKYLNEIKKY